VTGRSPIATIRTIASVTRLSGVGLVIAAFAILIAVPVAHAGDWMQVSCVSPNGTAATSQGWSGSSAGNPPPGSDATTACAPGQPMDAHLLQAFGAAPGGSIEALTYTPPTGSSLIGGTVDLTMWSTAANPNLTAVSETDLLTPGADSASVSNRVVTCIPFLGSCGSSTETFSGTVTLPAGRGGTLTADAQCISAGSSCMQGGDGTDWASTRIASADLLLSASDSPTGAGFSGSALQPRARGTAHLVFSAAVPSGPGVYAVSVAIDGAVVFNGQPNSNSGQCTPVGTDPATGAFMFDFAQPCLSTETVDIPIPTAGLPDGRHSLAVSVTDAAQNSATVFDQQVSTFNPQLTPLPRRGVKARFVISWRWAGRVTHLRSITVRKLPRRARLSASCRGRGCPRLKIASADARHVKKLLRALRARIFRAGDKLRLTVTAPHRRTERILLTVRAGAQPTARLLGRPPP
jgi:hypothetical protein